MCGQNPLFQQFFTNHCPHGDSVHLLSPRYPSPAFRTNSTVLKSALQPRLPMTPPRITPSLIPVSFPHPLELDEALQPQGDHSSSLLPHQLQLLEINMSSGQPQIPVLCPGRTNPCCQVPAGTSSQLIWLSKFPLKCSHCCKIPL